MEYAPFQRIPKRKKKKDPKCGTIESDPVYQEFIENLNKDQETENQPKLEYSYPINDGNTLPFLILILPWFFIIHESIALLQLKIAIAPNNDGITTKFIKVVRYTMF